MHMEKSQKARYTIDKGRKVTRQNALYPPAVHCSISFGKHEC